MSVYLLKITFIFGLQETVEQELLEKQSFTIQQRKMDSFIVSYSGDIGDLFTLKSILHIYIINQDDHYHPAFLVKHKSILGDLIKFCQKNNPLPFSTYHLSCAGDQTPEVLAIKKYIEQTFRLVPDKQGDIKIYIARTATWEMGVSITPRPLSMRDYKVEHIPGGINATVAYAMNKLANLHQATSYLNPCSGSATLLIEAARLYPSLTYKGFDHNKKHISQAIQNIKKAGYLKTITLHLADIFDAPDLGTFDVIVSDLPFGMQINKGEDLEKLYSSCIDYCFRSLKKQGRLVLYTTEYEILLPLLEKNSFHIIQNIELKIVSSINSYIYPHIIYVQKQ